MICVAILTIFIAEALLSFFSLIVVISRFCDVSDKVLVAHGSEANHRVDSWIFTVLVRKDSELAKSYRTNRPERMTPVCNLMRQRVISV